MDQSQEGTSFSTSRKGYTREEVDEYVAAKERLIVDANHDIRQLQNRIAELEQSGSRVVQLEDDLARAGRKAGDLEEKLEELRTEAISGTDDADLRAARQRIQDLEHQLLNSADADALSSVQRRVEELEQQLEIATDSDGLALAQRRIHELETQLAALSDDDRLGQAQQRIEELEEQLASGGATDESVRIMLVEATKTRDQMISEATAAAERSRIDADEEAGRIVEQAVTKAQEIVSRAKSEGEAEREASAAASARMINEANDRVQALRDESRDVLEQREAEIKTLTEQHESNHAELVLQLTHMRDAYAAFEERLRNVAEATIEEIATDQRGFEEFDLPEPGAAVDAEYQARQTIAGMIAEIEQHTGEPSAVSEAAHTEVAAAAGGGAASKWHDRGSVAAEPVDEHLEWTEDEQAAPDDVAPEPGQTEVHEPAAAESDDLEAEVHEEAAASEDAGDHDETPAEPDSANGEVEYEPSLDADGTAEHEAEAPTSDEPIDYLEADDDFVDSDDNESFYSKRGSKLPRLGEEATKEALGGLNSLRSSFKD